MILRTPHLWTTCPEVGKAIKIQKSNIIMGDDSVKKLISVILACCMVLMLMQLSAVADNEISVYLDGERLEFDVPPQIIDNQPMIPFRVIFEALGFEVEWVEEWQMVRTLRYGIEYSISIGLQIGFDTMAITFIYAVDYVYPFTYRGVAESIVEFDVPPMIVENRTLVPLRAISEALGAEVDWCGDTHTVTINAS